MAGDPGAVDARTGPRAPANQRPQLPWSGPPAARQVTNHARHLAAPGKSGGASECYGTVRSQWGLLGAVTPGIGLRSSLAASQPVTEPLAGSPHRIATRRLISGLFLSFSHAFLSFASLPRPLRLLFSPLHFLFPLPPSFLSTSNLYTSILLPTFSFSIAYPFVLSSGSPSSRVLFFRSLSHSYLTTHHSRLSLVLIELDYLLQVATPYCFRAHLTGTDSETSTHTNTTTTSRCPPCL